MQALNVPDDQAFNALLDQCSIEKYCLFQSKDAAEKACLVGASGNYKRMPHGMFEAYYPSLGGRSCSRFSVSDGNIQTRMNIVNVDKHRSVLGVDAGTQREESMAQVEQASNAVLAARVVADDETRKAKETRRVLSEAEQKRSTLANQESQLSRQKQKFQTELMGLQAEKNDTTDPTEELERTLTEANEALDAVAAEMATMEERLREAHAQIEPFQDARTAAVGAHQEAQKECDHLSNIFEKDGAGESKHQANCGRTKARLAKAEEELKDTTAERDAAVEDCRLALEKTETYMNNIRRKEGLEWDGLRVPTRHSLEKLRHKIQVAMEKYDKEKESRKIRGKSKEEVLKQLQLATDTFREKTMMAEQLESNMTMLANAKKERLSKWKLMRSHVARRTSILFNEYLQEKGASGEVTFNFSECTLGLTYQKDSADDDGQCSDVKLLSGGERSFSTLALLLALGSGHECPFRVMDEFDVFMDAMSRNIAMKQVITFAKNKSNRQFILITPQDLSSVTPTATCRIHKMRAPRTSDHNQATLDDMMG